MKLHLLPVFFVVLFAIGCSRSNFHGEQDSAHYNAPLKQNITSVVLTTHFNPQERVDSTTIFVPSDTIHAVITTANIPERYKLIGRWYYIQSKKLLAENMADVQPGDNITHFEMAKRGPWPEGDYRIDLLLNNQLVKIDTFMIKAEPVKAKSQ